MYGGVFLRDSIINQEATKTKVLFFDEFDAPMAEEPLGRLRWFLAPMQDGKLFKGDELIELGKAVLFFAGGTAPTLEEFERRAALDPKEFRAKKVPDFISRLQCFIDIQGINNEVDERPIRRALVLKHLLSKRWPDRSSEKGFPMSEELTRKLLSNTHFVHGVRSLLETSRLAADKELMEEDLPDNELRRLHISRGPLDGKVIGVSAGLQDLDSMHLLGELTKRF